MLALSTVRTPIAPGGARPGLRVKNYRGGDAEQEI
jgi:hypothetical protein